MLDVEALERLLPQTQCEQCGYKGCRPYAEALLAGHADINQCPPGGEAGIRRLAKALGREEKPLNPEHGVHQPPHVAWIDEDRCIGCTLCIQACPVDAIVGAAKQMHTVFMQDCTGCALCLPPCPVECIEMVRLVWPLKVIGWRRVCVSRESIALLKQLTPQRGRYLQKKSAAAEAARQHHADRLVRLARDQEKRAAMRQPLPEASVVLSSSAEASAPLMTAEAKKAAIQAAMARVAALKAAHKN